MSNGRGDGMRREGGREEGIDGCRMKGDKEGREGMSGMEVWVKGRMEGWKGGWVGSKGWMDG